MAQAIVEASLEAMVETVFEETMADAENGPKRPEDGPKSSRRLLAEPRVQEGVDNSNGKKVRFDMMTVF